MTSPAILEFQVKQLREENARLTADRDELVEALRPFAAMRLSTENDCLSNKENRTKELQELMEWRDKPIRETRTLLIKHNATVAP